MNQVAISLREMKAKLAATALCVALCGCVTTQSFLGPREEPPPLIVQAHSWWEQRVLTTADILGGGRMVPCVAGRVYLFGVDMGHPLKGTGTVTVDMYDATRGQPEAGTKPLVHIDYEKTSLKEFSRKDTIGWGYTLMIPWENYNPAVTRVQIHVRYNPEKGAPIFAPPTNVTLKKE